MTGGKRVVVPGEIDRPLLIPLFEFGGIWTHHLCLVLDLALALEARPSEERLLRWLGLESWGSLREVHG